VGMAPLGTAVLEVVGRVVPDIEIAPHMELAVHTEVAGHMELAHTEAAHTEVVARTGFVVVHIEAVACILYLAGRLESRHQQRRHEPASQLPLKSQPMKLLKCDLFKDQSASFGQKCGKCVTTREVNKLMILKQNHTREKEDKWWVTRIGRKEERK
jgi:hypothetical protein